MHNKKYINLCKNFTDFYVQIHVKKNISKKGDMFYEIDYYYQP